MKKTSLLDYLPKQKEPTALFQVHMSESILEEMRQERARLDVSWRDLIDAMFRKFLDDRKKRSR